MRPALPYQSPPTLLSPESAITELWPSHPAAPEDEFSFEHYWEIIRKHLFLIVGLLLVAEALTALALSFVTPKYTAASTILIESEMPQVLEQVNARGEGTDDTSGFYRTQYEILNSRRLAATVVHNLRLDKNPIFNEASAKVDQSWVRSLVRGIGLAKAYLLSWLSRPKLDASRDEKTILGVDPGLIDAYLGGLSVRPSFETRLVSIAYTSRDPVLAAEIADAHVQAFVQMNYELHKENNDVEKKYLQGELVKLESRLEKSEAALNQYRRARGIVAFSSDNRDQNLAERMTALTKGLIDAEETRIDLEAEVKTINSRNFDAVPEVVTSVLIQNLKEETSKLEGQHASLANQFTANYPPVAQLEAQLNDSRQRLQTEIRRVVDSIKARYEASKQREAELGAQVEAEKARVMALKDASLQDAVLAREVEMNDSLYKNVLERIKMLGVAGEARVTNVSVIDEAETPITPSSPKIRLSMVLSGFLTLIFGICAAFVIEGTDRGLKDATEVQSYLGLPNLATVVRFCEPERIESAHGDGTVLVPARSNGHVPLLNGAAAMDKSRTPLLDRLSGREPSTPDSRKIANEAYRAIRTSILLSRSEQPPRTILFTSAAMEEGKSVTAVNTAVSFAGMVDRVLLIDADLRHPTCHRILVQPGSPGLTEVLTGLSGLEKAVRSTRMPGLFFLSAGSISPNPTELLGSARMRKLLEALSSEYDHVVIDSAPVLPVSDSAILSTIVDGVVVVAARETPRSAVREACSRLDFVGANILGAVLNRAEVHHRHYYAPYTYLHE